MFDLSKIFDIKQEICFSRHLPWIEKTTTSENLIIYSKGPQYKYIQSLPSNFFEELRFWVHCQRSSLHFGRVQEATNACNGLWQRCTQKKSYLHTWKSKSKFLFSIFFCRGISSCSSSFESSIEYSISSHVIIR